MSYQFANDKNLDELYAALPQTLKDEGYVGGDLPKPVDLNYIGRLAQEAYAEGVDSGLKVVTEGAEGSETTGYRLNGVPLTGKDTIGASAVDLSGDASDYTGRGPTAFAAYTEGWGTRAAGIASHAEGIGVSVEKQGCHGEGVNNTIPATAPLGAHVEGALATETDWEEKMSVIGIGGGSGRKDGRILYTDGTMELPEATIQNNFYRGGKAVSTLESARYIKTPSSVWVRDSYILTGNETVFLMQFPVPFLTGGQLVIDKFGFAALNGGALKYTIGVLPSSVSIDPIQASSSLYNVVSVGVTIPPPASPVAVALISVSVTYDGTPAEGDRTLDPGSTVWVEYHFIKAE